MRLAAASALASLALLMPLKSHAFEAELDFERPGQEVLRTIAEPGTDPLFLPSSISLFHAALTNGSAMSVVELFSEKRMFSVKEICSTVASAAMANDLPVFFFLRLIWQESRFDPLAISRAGAQGIAQFMPRVAAAMGLNDPFDPEQALPKSARFLRTLHEQFGNIGLAAAAYNAGARRIQDWLAK